MAEAERNFEIIYFDSINVWKRTLKASKKIFYPKLLSVSSRIATKLSSYSCAYFPNYVILSKEPVQNHISFRKCSMNLHLKHATSPCTLHVLFSLDRCPVLNTFPSIPLILIHSSKEYGIIQSEEQEEEEFSSCAEKMFSFEQFVIKTYRETHLNMETIGPSSLLSGFQFTTKKYFKQYADGQSF